VRVIRQAPVQVKEVTAALIILLGQFMDVAAGAAQARLVQMELLAAVVMEAQEQQIVYLDQALPMRVAVVAVVKVERLAQAAQVVAAQAQGLTQTLRRELSTEAGVAGEAVMLFLAVHPAAQVEAALSSSKFLTLVQQLSPVA
jgi:hypothetical protein